MSPAADPLRQSLDVLARAWWRVRWARVLARQPGPLALLARYPDEPAFN